MNSGDIVYAVFNLLKQGYMVRMIDEKATNFSKRYAVYEPVGSDQLKRAIVNGRGEVVTSQGKP